MSYDLNDAAPQLAPMGELIPDGTFAKVVLHIRPGGTDGAVAMDAGLLKASQSSDARMLDCEFTVTAGPLARRKFWQNFTVAGGKLDEKGQSKGWNIAKSTFRAMIDSALGLDPQDDRPEVREKRVIAALKQLDGITFAARIMVERPENPDYRPANRLANVVLPGEPQYAAIMRGETVPPEPVNAPPRKAPQQTQAPPAWGGQAQGGWSNTPQAPAQQPATPAPSTAPPWLNT